MEAGQGQGQTSKVGRTGGFKEVVGKRGSVVSAGACCEPFRGVSRKSRSPLSNHPILTLVQDGGSSQGLFVAGFFFYGP